MDNTTDASVHSSNSHTPSILRMADVVRRVGLSKASVYRLMRAGLFPRQVALGMSAVGWVESEVRQWIAERIQERDRETMQPAM